MKTVLHIANTSVSIVKLLEVVPNIEDWIFTYEATSALDTNNLNYDDYCKHQVKSRDWHLYDDHTEASILVGVCSRRDKCILAPRE